jgi:hypothetical protein
MKRRKRSSKQASRMKMSSKMWSSVSMIVEAVAKMNISNEEGRAEASRGGGEKGE